MSNDAESGRWLRVRPPIGPAVANAIFDATGEMPAELPPTRGGLA